MKKINVILTGASGMVGEGILMECLQNDRVSKVLMINRRHISIEHSKLSELLVQDFFQIEKYNSQLSGFDACFFCAGISSLGMKEADYTHTTYDTTLYFAKALLKVNPQMVFHYVSGRSTDSTGKSRMMWARVKGKTENALMTLGFKKQYNFRPGFMEPFPGQKNVKPILKFFGYFYPIFFPESSLTLKQVGQAMINLLFSEYPRAVLEVSDIKQVASLK